MKDSTETRPTAAEVQALPHGPDFLVIGAQKCGTSWLSKMIGCHPAVFTPFRKELHFFDRQQNYARGIEWYENLFSGRTTDQVAGEYTPNYFWNKGNRDEMRQSGHTKNIPELIRHHYPTVKLIVSLRDPVERAISAYYHHIRRGRISPSTRISKIWNEHGILSMGFYADHLQEWFAEFPPEQLLILLQDQDIIKNRDETVTNVYKFIGIHTGFLPKNSDRQYNARASHLYLRINRHSPRLATISERALPDVVRTHPIWRIPVHGAEREELREIFHRPNEKLEELIGRRTNWNLGS